jgi:hypothetical protein
MASIAKQPVNIVIMGRKNKTKTPVIVTQEELEAFWKQHVEIQLTNEHALCELIELKCTDYKYLPFIKLSGLLPVDDKALNPPRRYPFIPDQRIFTFRLLSKDSPGLSPPSFLFT